MTTMIVLLGIFQIGLCAALVYGVYRAQKELTRYRESLDRYAKYLSSKAAVLEGMEDIKRDAEALGFNANPTKENIDIEEEEARA